MSINEENDASDDTIYINIDTSFYSQNSIVPTDHYIGIINTDMDRNVRGCLDFLFNKNYSYYNDFCCTYHDDVVTKLLPIYEDNDLALTYKIVPDGSIAGAQIMCFLKVGVGANVLSESDMNSSISMIDTSNVGGFKKFTYAVGDIDHNGILDVNDAYYLSNFLLARDVKISYEGEFNDIVNYAVWAAMDVNMDGEVNVFDLSLLKRYILINSPDDKENTNI